MKAMSLVLVLAFLLTGCNDPTNQPVSNGPQNTAAPDIKDKLVLSNGQSLSGPFVYENLSIFLIHGPSKVDGKAYLTLQEAMDHKKVIVHETQNVNELAIENVSDNEEVYVQSGDIVKGGKQDRLMAMDFIVPAKSGRMPIASFCVEHGRWTQRGTENATMFNSSASQAASKDIRLAAKREHNQGLVWQKVAETQQKLSDNSGIQARDDQSPSSLQLAQENKKVELTTAEYIKTLKDIINDKPDTIGFAFAINGKVNSVDSYLSHDLFKKLWPKLLKASAIEAIAERHSGQPAAPVKPSDVKATIDDAESGKIAESNESIRVKTTCNESDLNVNFKTYDKSSPTTIVHNNYIVK